MLFAFTFFKPFKPHNTFYILYSKRMPALEVWLWRWVLEGSSVIGLKYYKSLNQ